MIAITTALLATLAAATQQDPQTTPERTKFAATSTSQQVDDFIASLADLPHGSRITSEVFGSTVRGRKLRCVTATTDAKVGASTLRGRGKLRALILANIHGGEVEGKESVQVLLREIANGEHTEILQRCDLVFVPIFNLDGNDAIAVGNRPTQNGPDGGSGKRHNAQDLDLNRDYIKAETPEVRSHLRLLNVVDPHLYMDLHTTNGSDHGYHLTYAPSLSTNLDPELDAFTHDEFTPSVRAAMSALEFRVFDYGNFPSRRARRARGWYTFDHKPRLGWNYAGLRNRISILSEAYSYVPFKQRIAVTRAFVLENIRALVAMEQRVRALFTRADARTIREGTPRLQLGYDSEFAEPVLTDLLVTEVATAANRGRRKVASPDATLERNVPVHVRFEARRSIIYPRAWAVIEPSDVVRQTLLLHGLEVEQLLEPVTTDVETFWPTAISKPRMVFQGHRLVRIRGELANSSRTLPAGTLIVRARQRLARIGAMLLDPYSEDSLTTWNFFDSSIRRVEATEADDAALAFPVVRIHRVPAWKTERCRINDEHFVNERLFDPAPANLSASIELSVVCTEPGEAVRNELGETTEWRGRSVAYAIGSDRFDSLDQVLASLRERTARADFDAATPLVLRPNVHTDDAELIEAARVGREAGFAKVLLDVSKRE